MAIAEDYNWYGESVEEEEFGSIAQVDTSEYPTTPSQFTEFGMMMPSGGKLRNFSFDGRRYLRTIYDSPAKRKLIVAGRQVEKSTLLGNMILSYCSLTSGFRALYVSPSHMQTKVFSRDRIKEPIETSEILSQFTNSKLLSNILEKKFINRSQVTLRFVFLNADRVRGIPADLINIDEFQDIIQDNVPVIEECASHSEWKLFNYLGTPKSLDGTLEYYWSQFSTQNEWAVPCRHHGTPKDPSSWHWNILEEDNIGTDGLICDKCGNIINPADPDACWASMNPKPKVEKPFEGYRIPQLMVPWIEWDDILHKQRSYSRAKFYNEVLGRSYDSGTRPLTRAQMQKCANEELSMDHYLEVANRYLSTTSVFMGIDWGTGEGSYTVVSLGGYMPWDMDKFTFFYFKRFSGMESEPEVQLRVIKHLIKRFKVHTVGVDYGGGHWPNDKLMRAFGVQRIRKFQWVGNVRDKLRWDPKLLRFLCHRTEIMSDIFNAIKKGSLIRFPRWDEFNDPFAADFLNIFSEYNEKLKMNVFKHAPKQPDDTAHSAMFCLLGSFAKYPRPDILLPFKDVDQDLDDDDYDSEDDEVLY